MELAITVLITAYNRREYLREAVESALNQTLPRDKYEVILTKNFDSPLDDEWRQRGIKLIRFDEPGIGKRVAHALPHCRGRVIAFLEDDDRWSPSKLQTVAKMFSETGKLGLTHNNYLEIDREGRPLRVGPQCNLYVHGERVTAMSLHALGRCNAFFNSSCFSVRRDILERSSDLIKSINAVDVLLPYLALSMGYGVASIPDALTSYRVHTDKEAGFWGGDTSPFLAKRYRERLEVYERVLEIVYSHRAFDKSARDAVTHEFYRYRVLCDVITGASSRDKLEHSLELGRRALFDGNRSRQVREIKTCLAGGLSTVFPEATKNYLLRRISRALEERML